jgi:hypothetical protein
MKHPLASNNAVERNGGVRIRWLVTFVLDNHKIPDIMP